MAVLVVRAPASGQVGDPGGGDAAPGTGAVARLAAAERAYMEARLAFDLAAGTAGEEAARTELERAAAELAAAGGPDGLEERALELDYVQAFAASWDAARGGTPDSAAEQALLEAETALGADQSRLDRLRAEASLFAKQHRLERLDPLLEAWDRLQAALARLDQAGDDQVVAARTRVKAARRRFDTLAGDERTRVDTRRAARDMVIQAQTELLEAREHPDDEAARQRALEHTDLALALLRMGQELGGKGTETFADLIELLEQQRRELAGEEQDPEGARLRSVIDALTRHIDHSGKVLAGLSDDGAAARVRGAVEASRTELEELKAQLAAHETNGRTDADAAAEASEPEHKPDQAAPEDPGDVASDDPAPSGTADGDGRRARAPDAVARLAAGAAEDAPEVVQPAATPGKVMTRPDGVGDGDDGGEVATKSAGAEVGDESPLTGWTVTGRPNEQDEDQGEPWAGATVAEPGPLDALQFGAGARITVPAPLDLLGGMTGGTRILVPPTGPPAIVDWPGGWDAGVGVGGGGMGGLTDERLPAPPDVAATRLG
jgi:hypothetical protein